MRRFWRRFVEVEGASELTIKYQARFIKNEDRLFTFLDHDNVPWKNNNAELAIKGFVKLRRVIGGLSTEKSIVDTLLLLSICQTLKNKSLSYLEFLKSEDRSLREFIGDGW